jgi:hypothetical protein
MVCVCGTGVDADGVGHTGRLITDEGGERYGQDVESPPTRTCVDVFARIDAEQGCGGCRC